MSIKIITDKEAAELVTGQSGQFARIPNPSYVYPDFEICPIAPALTEFTKPPVTAVMDMDGTTTTTETLCIHSLEFAVRKAMGSDGSRWAGLNPQQDYPHIIGNSTTNHVEHLVDTYGHRFDAAALGNAFLEAVQWTLENSRDNQRKQQVRINLRQAGLSENRSAKNREQDRIEPDEKRPDNNRNVQFENHELHIANRDLQIQACIDIYYRRYHEILAAIENGDREFLRDIPGVDPGKPLIEPMPGIAITLALLKGDLGEDAGNLAGIINKMMPGNSSYSSSGKDNKRSRSQETNPEEAKRGMEHPDHERNEFNQKSNEEDSPDARAILSRLGSFFQRHPVKLALVTSSIRYEAEVVMKEVFHVLRNEVASWPVSPKTRSRLDQRFRDPLACYDAFVTAGESSEIRLKPFRDLYSIALHQTGVNPDEFDAVIGFEDSQSGTVAIRAAGIGRCIALPFNETGGHTFDAASIVAEGGLPEVLIRYRFFLSDLLYSETQY